VAKLIVQDVEHTYLVDLGTSEGVLVGRAPAADLPVLAERASRRHAEIRGTGLGHVLVDLGSTNGTLLNGVLLGAAADAEMPLRDGDVIDVGGCTLLYRV